MSASRIYLPYLKKKERFLNLAESLRGKRLHISHWEIAAEFNSKLRKTKPGGIVLNTADSIVLSSAEAASEAFKETLRENIQNLIPWRTGPFNLFGNEIDSEWRSNLRWDRLKPFLPSLNDKLVADIGCGNGYFMFRMLEQNPKLIIGVDPQPRCVLQFELLNAILDERRLRVEPLGIENMDVFSDYFDLVLCMGVIYHRRDPHTCLTKVRESMKPGAKILMETIVIEGRGELCFSPPGRFMKMRNVWFVPTIDCLLGWFKKCGYTGVELLLEYTLLPDEQRRTMHSPDESYIDFVDPHNPELTVEGYPLPKRAIISAIA